MTPPLTRKAGILSDERDLQLYVLLKFLIRELGVEYLAWDSIALRLELEERWGQVGDLTWQRVQAGRTMAGHDGFWIHMEIFENCALALVGEIPVFSHMQPLEAESVAVTLLTARMIKEHPYSDEVLGYALACCLNDATWFFEDYAPLAILKPALADHDAEFGIVRPHAAVVDSLSRHSRMISDPQGQSEVQTNNVISVRNTLSEYQDLINRQLSELKL